MSRMTGGALSAPFVRLLMNFLAYRPGHRRLKDERDKVDVRISVKLVLSAPLAMCSGLVMAAATRAVFLEQGAAMETSQYVVEQLRLKTRSMRACSR